MTKTNTFKFVTIAAAIFLAALLIVLITQNNRAYGSVAISNEYNATTTASNVNTYGNTIADDTVVATSSITLGSVVITGANTGVFNIYDATTSDPNKRKLASTSVLIASFPTNTATGTYTFDVRLNDGLLIDLQSGVMPTTTITTRR